MTQPLEVYAAGARTAGQLCAVCQTAIIAGEHVVFCPDCALPYHEECWTDNGGCAQYGCRSAAVTAKPDADAGLVSTVWGDEKRCPACGRPIRARAAKCRYCGAVFGTRDAISRADYARREYQGADYTRARNTVVAAFILSATGFLSLIALILLGMLIFGRKGMGLEYPRLPLALKALAHIGFWLSCLLLLLMIGFGIAD